MTLEVLSNLNGSVIHPGYSSNLAVRELSSSFHEVVCVWI